MPTRAYLCRTLLLAMASVWALIDAAPAVATFRVHLIDLHGHDVADHHALVRPEASQDFTFTAGPADGLVRSTDEETFLILRCSL